MRYSTTSYFQDIIFTHFKKINYEKIVSIFHEIADRLFTFFEVDFRSNINRVLPNLPHGFVIVFLGFLFSLMLLYHTEQNSGIRVINLRTSSMEPSIASASIVVTYPKTKYGVGDIVTYRETSLRTGIEYSRTLTHRIVDQIDENDKRYFITKGDSNNYPDPGMIEKSQILGKVVMIVPYLGYLGIFIKTVPGFFLLVALPSFLVVVNEIKFIKSIIVERS